MASSRPSARSSIFSLLILSFVLIAIGGLIFAILLSQALRSTRSLQAVATSGDLKAACSGMPQTARAWRRVERMSTPLAPLFYNLGWLPVIGSDVRILPTAVVLAQSGSSAGVQGCEIFKPVLDVTTLPERLTGAAEQIRARPDEFTTLVAELRQAHNAALALAPNLGPSSRLGPYRDQLKALGPQLGYAVDALEALQGLGPDLDWLLGLDGQRRFLLVLQNPFELRPTGGFMGLICVLRVEQAQPGIEDCQTSEAYATPAPQGVEMPSPYGRYLRFGNYYLRDANWSPDFPTTAKRIQEFWAWNGQSPLDGVIATDLYALAPLVSASGSIELDDGTKVGQKGVLDTLLTRYYDGRVRRDKAGISEMLPSMLDQMLRADAGSSGRLLQSLGTIITQRHLLVAINKPAVMAVLAEHGWDGGVYAVKGDSLRIVDADVGYGGVNAFVDRLTQYQVEVAQDGSPLTATLTLTYTNRYSAWAEATTPHAVYGKCSDPVSLELQRRQGCFADYLRVYVPFGSQLLDISGMEEPALADERYDRTVLGGYFRVFPGETRQVQLRYRLPETARGSLLIEKQPGTAAPPFHVIMQRGTRSVEAWVSGETDVRLITRADRSGLRIDAAQDQQLAVEFERVADFARGLSAWQNGEREQALRIWKDGQAIDLALDHVTRLSNEGEREGARALVEALAPLDTTGRAWFERAILIEPEDAIAAESLFRRAAGQSPDNPLAQLMWLRSLSATRQAFPEERSEAVSASAIRRWRESAFDLERAGSSSAASDYWQALLAFTPDDGSLALHTATLLQQAARPEEARATLNTLAGSDDIWGRLAAARLEVLDGASEAAAVRYREALPLATSESIASEIGAGLRDAGDVAGAQQAFEQAATLAPDSIWPLVAIGDLLRSSDPAAARTWYERARALDPNTGYQQDSGYPDFALGRLLAETGDDSAALPLLESAVAREPERPEYRALLEEVRARLGA